MIPAAVITEWSHRAAWPAVEQVEQDLLLSRLIVEIANDDYLGGELVFRGGTCMHKLHLMLLCLSRQNLGPQELMPEVVEAAGDVGEGAVLGVGGEVVEVVDEVFEDLGEFGRVGGVESDVGHEQSLFVGGGAGR